MSHGVWLSIRNVGSWHNRSQKFSKPCGYESVRNLNSMVWIWNLGFAHHHPTPRHMVTKMSLHNYLTSSTETSKEGIFCLPLAIKGRGYDSSATPEANFSCFMQDLVSRKITEPYLLFFYFPTRQLVSCKKPRIISSQA